MHPGYLSNAYLVADEEGGTAVYVDSGAPLEPLLEAVARWRVTPVAVLRTHAHGDHVEHEDELGLPVVTGDFESGGLRVEALPTPGHSDDHVAFVVNGEACFSGDILFKDAVGGTATQFEQVRHSVMDVLMAAAAGDARPPRPYRRDDDRAGVGGEPVCPRVARRRARRHGGGSGRR